MTLTQLVVFAFAITGFGKNATSTVIVESPMIKEVRERSEAAATAIHTIFTDGYVLEVGKPPVKVKPLFEVTDTFTLEQAIEASEKLVAQVAWHESAYVTSAHRTVDGSGDCGIMQTKPHYISFVAKGKTCDDVKKDINLGVFVGIQVLHLHRDMCIEKLSPKFYEKLFNSQYWLGAYASGHCGKAPKTARALCGPAGVCELK